MLFDEFYSPLPDIDAYLQRIEMNQPIHPDLDYLKQLIYQHQTHIPFENIDVHIRKQNVSLAIDDLFQKIVLEHRGGYCFELNGLFYALLTELGYDATPCLCKILGLPFNHVISAHRGTIVHVDGKDYFCDVGFGGPVPAGPLLLEENLSQEICGDIYRIEKRSPLELALIRTNHQGIDEPVILINPTPFDPVDFVPYSHYLSCNSEKTLIPVFRENLMLNIRTDNGYISLTNTTLKESQNGQTVVTDVSDRELLLDVLHHRFFLPDSIDCYFE